MQHLIMKINIITNIPIMKWESHSDKMQDVGIIQIEINPLRASEELRRTLAEQTALQKVPVIYRDENKVFFACIKGKHNDFYLLGPMCTGELSNVELHRYYKSYQIRTDYEQHPPRFDIQRFLATVELLDYELNGNVFHDDEILMENHLTQKSVIEFEREEARQVGEEEHYHHTYQEEVRVMNYVREGNLEEINGAGEMLSGTVGKLSEDDFRHERNLGICSVTIATRAAIEGGVSPAKAYRLSDIYINRIDKAKNLTQVFQYRKQSLYDFTKLVSEERERKTYSNYVEQCKDYINRYYHNKIYLSDLGDALGVSESHISRVFKKETGENIQKYIQRFRAERAANLLKYSEASLTEVSDYVCFNSQSHFGSVFKKYYHMTPGEYRRKFQKKEFTVTGND